MLENIGGVFCEHCDVAERKVNLDESMTRFFGVADWAVDSDDARKLWVEPEKMIKNN